MWASFLAAGIIALLTGYSFNVMSLTTVASLGSATSLLVHSLVNFGAFRILKDGSANRTIIGASAVAYFIAIGVWFLYTIRNSPGSVGIFFSFLVIAFVAEIVLQRVKGRIRVKGEWNSEAPNRS